MTAAAEDSASVDQMLFTEEQASALSGLSRAQLRSWDENKMCSPSIRGEPPFARFYTFRDLVGLRTLAALRLQGVSDKQLRRAAQVLTHETTRPWSSLKFWLGKKLRSGRELYFSDPSTGVPLSADGTFQGAIPVALDEIVTQLRRAAANLRERRDEQHGKIERKRHVVAGEPVFSGTRIPVRLVKEYLDDGADVAEILLAYPSLTAKDVEAARSFVLPPTRRRVA